MVNKPYLALIMYLYCSLHTIIYKYMLSVYHCNCRSTVCCLLIGNGGDSSCTKSCEHWTGLGLRLHFTGLDYNTVDLPHRLTDPPPTKFGEHIG